MIIAFVIPFGFDLCTFFITLRFCKGYIPRICLEFWLVTHLCHIISKKKGVICDVCV